jgi:uncharacterized protein YbaP (TraB family)
VAGPTLWLVERGASKVFLFGETVGVRRDDAWLDRRIEGAIDGCREFWCEVADAAEVAASPALGRYGLGTEPLSRRLDGEQLHHLQATAHAVGVDPTTLEGLRPWLAGQLLESAHRERSGVDAAVDVHDVLLSLARDAGKVIRTELPNAEATLSFFGNLGEEAEIDYLLWTLDRVAQEGAEIRQQVAAWLVGDGSVVEAQVTGMRARYPALHRRLLADRNRAWVPRIEAMLRHPGTAFVLVGDSHLPGDDGLPALLTRRGLRPQRARGGP